MRTFWPVRAPVATGILWIKRDPPENLGLERDARLAILHEMRRSTLALTAVAILMLAAFASGCVKVAPYERGMLAHPTMTAEEISIGLDGHVRAVSEGAAGGLGGGGGGCGCN